MFTVKRPEKEPENCPLCPYYPVSLGDLKSHLSERHGEAGFERCQASSCGVVCLTAKELKGHYATAHKRRKTAEKLTAGAASKDDFQVKEPSSLNSHQACIQHIISDTKKYLSAMKKLSKPHSSDFTQCAEFPFVSILSHAQCIAQHFDPRVLDNSDTPEVQATVSRKRSRVEFSISTFLDLDTPIKELQLTPLSKHLSKPVLPRCLNCGAMFFGEPELRKHQAVKCEGASSKLSLTA